MEEQSAGNRRRMRRAREILQAVHRYVGLLLAIYVLLLSVTGGTIVFRYELDALLNPRLYAATPAAGTLDYDRIIANAQAAAPQGSKVSLLLPPAAGRDPVYLRATSESGSITELFVDPATSRVLGSRIYDRGVINILFQLHASLLMRDYGGDVIVGFGGLFIILMLASGLYLWWPRGGQQFWRALRARRRLRGIASLLQWHNLSGAYGAVAVLVISISGLCLSFPNEFSAVSAAVLPAEKRSLPPLPVVRLPAAPVSVAATARLAGQLMPGSQVTEVYPAVKPGDPIQVNVRFPDEINAFGVSHIIIDPASGRLVSAYRVGQASVADHFVNWQHAIHTGQIAGIPGRILVLCTAMVLPVLAVTGFLVWRRKRRNRPATRQVNKPCVTPSA